MMIRPVAAILRVDGFSALQRAENSSILTASPKSETNSAFQCSSASRKFLNRSLDEHSWRPALVSVLFSEPKIPQYRRHATITDCIIGFQCSSASRKFLNVFHPEGEEAPYTSFSALQRAENSSIVLTDDDLRSAFPFQCSSASRKFLNSRVETDWRAAGAFQCSSASRKFLNRSGSAYLKIA